MRRLRLVFAALFLVACGCAEKANSNRTGSLDGQPIGVAWLENDGTLVMQLRAETPGKARGDALLRYSPTDPQYHLMLEHVGGLKPGQTNPVPPWPQGTPSRAP